MYLTVFIFTYWYKIFTVLMFWPLIPFISFGVNLIPLIEIDVKGLTTQSFLPEEIGFYWDAKEFPNLSFPPVDKKKQFFLHFSSFPFFVEITNFQSALLNLESLREKLWRPMFEEICFYCISVFISLFCWK